jgi:hypothetical protein
MRYSVPGWLAYRRAAVLKIMFTPLPVPELYGWNILVLGSHSTEPKSVYW